MDDHADCIYYYRLIMTPDTDQRQFLRTITNEPLDLQARLVYADWLEENGEPERSEFIKIQIEITRLTDACTRPDCHCWRCIKIGTLRRRQEDLFLDAKARGEIGMSVARMGQYPVYNTEKCKVDIMVDVSGMPMAVSRFVWRNGFVEEVWCSPGDWDDRLSALTVHQPVRIVNLWYDHGHVLENLQKKWTKIGFIDRSDLGNILIRGGDMINTYPIIIRRNDNSYVIIMPDGDRLVSTDAKMWTHE